MQEAPPGDGSSWEGSARRATEAPIAWSPPRALGSLESIASTLVQAHEQLWDSRPQPHPWLREQKVPAGSNLLAKRNTRHLGGKARPLSQALSQRHGMSRVRREVRAAAKLLRDSGSCRAHTSARLQKPGPTSDLLTPSRGAISPLSRGKLSTR